MRSAWTRWLAGLAILGVTGCTSGGWSTASLWPWSKSNSTAAQTQTSLAKNTGKPTLPSQTTKPNTLSGGQTQVANNTAVPAWNNNNINLVGGTGALPNTAPGANQYTTPAPNNYAVNDPYGAVPPVGGGSPYTNPTVPGAVPGAGLAPGYAPVPNNTQNYGTQNYGTQNYGTPNAGALPGYGAGGLGTTPGYTPGNGTQTGVTPGFDMGAASNPFTQPATTPNYVGSVPGSAQSGFGAGAPVGGGVGATSQFPTTPAAGGASDYNVFANNTSLPPTAQAYPTTDAGSAYPSTSAGSFAPGSTRPMADSTGGTQMAGGSSLAAPAATNYR